LRLRYRIAAPAFDTRPLGAETNSPYAGRHVAIFYSSLSLGFDSLGLASCTAAIFYLPLLRVHEACSTSPILATPVAISLENAAKKLPPTALAITFIRLESTFSASPDGRLEDYIIEPRRCAPTPVTITAT
jgi:hypothetical protein